MGLAGGVAQEGARVIVLAAYGVALYFMAALAYPGLWVQSLVLGVLVGLVIFIVRLIRFLRSNY